MVRQQLVKFAARDAMPRDAQPATAKFVGSLIQNQKHGEEVEEWHEQQQEV